MQIFAKLGHFIFRADDRYFYERGKRRIAKDFPPFYFIIEEIHEVPARSILKHLLLDIACLYDERTVSNGPHLQKYMEYSLVYPKVGNGEKRIHGNHGSILNFFGQIEKRHFRADENAFWGTVEFLGYRLSFFMGWSYVCIDAQKFRMRIHLFYFFLNELSSDAKRGEPPSAAVSASFLCISAFSAGMAEEEITGWRRMQDNMRLTRIAFHDIATVGADRRRRKSAACGEDEHMLIILNIFLYFFLELLAEYLKFFLRFPFAFLRFLFATHVYQHFFCGSERAEF